MPAPTFDLEIAKMIIALVEAGNYPLHACKSVGVPKRTMDNWIVKGRKYTAAIEAGEPANPDHKILADFAHSMMKARAAGIVARFDKLDKAGPKIWRKHAWILAHLAPNQWGKVENMTGLDKKLADQERIKEARDRIAADPELSEKADEFADRLSGKLGGEE